MYISEAKETLQKNNTIILSRLNLWYFIRSHVYTSVWLWTVGEKLFMWIRFRDSFNRKSTPPVFSKYQVSLVTELIILYFIELPARHKLSTYKQTMSTSFPTRLSIFLFSLFLFVGRNV